MVLDELSVVLKGDSTHYDQAMKRGIEILGLMERSAVSTAAQLEKAAKAWGKASAGSDERMRAEAQMKEALVVHQQQVESNLLKDRLSKMEETAEKEYSIDQARFQVWRQQEELKVQLRKTLEEEKLKVDQQAFESWRSIENAKEVLDQEYFNLTQSLSVRQMNTLKRQYTQRMELYGSDAKAREAIERNYQVQVTRIQEEEQAKQTAILLGRRGLLRVGLMQGLALSGLPGAGMVGQLMSSIAFGGMTYGAPLAGIQILSSAIDHVRGRIKEIQDFAAAYKKDLEAASRSWQEIVVSQTSTTTFGGTLRQQISGYRGQIEDMAKLWEEEYGGVWAGLGKAVERTLIPSMTLFQAHEMDMMLWRRKHLTDQLDMLRQISSQEERLQSTRVREDLASSYDRSVLGMFKPGPESRSRSLSFETEERTRSVRRSYEDRIRAMDLARELARREEYTANMLKPGTIDTITEEKKFQDARQRLTNEANEALRVEEEKGLVARAILNTQFAEERRREDEQYQESKIKLSQTGVERERSLLRVQHDRELSEFRGHNRAMLEERQKNERALLEKETSKRLVDVGQSLQDTIDVLSGKTQQAQVEWRKFAETLANEFGVIGKAADGFKVLFDRAKWYELNQPLINQTEDLRIQIDQLVGALTKEEAVRLRLRNTYKDADPVVLEDLRRRQHELDLAQWVKAQREALHPAMRLKEIWEKVQEAMNDPRGFLSIKEAAEIMRKAFDDIYGKQGEFKTFRAAFWDIRGAAAVQAENPILNILKDQRHFQERMENHLRDIARKDPLN